MPRRFGFPRILLVSALLVASVAGCRRGGGGDAPVAERDRVVFVLDPTMLTTADSARLDEEVLADLRGAIAGFPPNTWVDAYMVGAGRIEGRPEIRDSLPFDPRGTSNDAHLRRADTLGIRASGLYRERWNEVHRNARQPASCLLTAIRRARPSFARGGKGGTERVGLVLVSDLMETCSDFGRYDFERAIPDSFATLADSIDLSRVDRVYLVKIAHPKVTSVGQSAKLDSVWARLLRRWGVPGDRIDFGPTVPPDPFSGS